jgi:hypothetical protein
LLPSLEKVDIFTDQTLSDQINGTKFEVLSKYFDWSHIPAQTAKNKLSVDIIHEVSIEERESNNKEELID